MMLDIAKLRSIQYQDADNRISDPTDLLENSMKYKPESDIGESEQRLCTRKVNLESTAVHKWRHAPNCVYNHRDLK